MCQGILKISYYKLLGKNGNTFYGCDWNNTINKSVTTNAKTPEESLDEIKQQLDNLNPVIISGNDGTKNGDHFVLVVEYINNGDKLQDYVVVDPYHSFAFPRTMNDFYAENNYPFPCRQIGSTYEIRIFNSRSDIFEVLYP